MTVSTTISRKAYAGDGGSVAFPTTFEFFDASDLTVILIDSAGTATVQTLTTHYTVSGGSGSTGTVTMVTAPASGETLVVLLNEDLTQTADFTPGGTFPASSFENALDRLAMVNKQQQDAIDRSIKQPAEEAPLDMELPNAADRAGKFLAFGPTGEPSSSSGTGADSGLRADLASTTATEGAALVGYKSPLTGGVGRTVQGKLEDVVSVKDFGAVGDGATDDTAAIQAALDSGAGAIFFPAGTYKITASLNSSDSLLLFGEGAQTILDMSGTFTGLYGINFTGSLTQIEELGANASAGDATLTFASTPSLSVGDIAIIYNPTDSSWSGHRTLYRAGEFIEVRSISGSTVDISHVLYDDYVVADVDIYKLTGPSPCIRDMHIKGGTVLGLCLFSMCVRPLVENVTSTHANNSIISFDRCWKPRVINSDGDNEGDGGDDYGVFIGNSQHVRVEGGNWYARRHAITTGGLDDTGCVTNRDVRISLTTLRNDPASLVSAANFHGNTEDAGYENCTIYGGVDLQGKDVWAKDCVITANGRGAFVSFAEVLGGAFDVSGNKFRGYINAGVTSRGLIDVGGAGTATDASTVLPLTVRVRDNFVYGRNYSAVNTYFMRFVQRGGAAAVNFDIDNNTFDVDTLAGILRTDLTLGTAASDFIIITGVNNAPSGAFLHTANGSHYLNFSHRLQAQAGYVDVECTSAGKAAIAADQTFRYAYPREPRAFIGHSSTDGSTKSLWGGQALADYIHQVTATKIRPAVYSASGSTFTSTENVRLHWEVGISEV